MAHATVSTRVRLEPVLTASCFRSTIRNSSFVFQRDVTGLHLCAFRALINTEDLPDAAACSSATSGPFRRDGFNTRGTRKPLHGEIDIAAIDFDPIARRPVSSEAKKSGAAAGKPSSTMPRDSRTPGSRRPVRSVSSPGAGHRHPPGYASAVQ
jgi:hypothetical protein